MAKERKHKVVVDGETYWVRRLDPFDSLRLDALGTKMLGGLFRALATSSGARDFVGQFLKDGADPAELMEQDVQGILMHVVGTSLNEIADRIDGDDLIRAVELCVMGSVSTPHGGAAEVMFERGDQDTYAEVIGDRMRKHGHWHQLKLLWAVVQANMGPTTAGGDTSPQSDGAPAAP